MDTKDAVGVIFDLLSILSSYRTPLLFFGIRFTAIRSLLQIGALDFQIRFVICIRVIRYHRAFFSRQLLVLGDGLVKLKQFVLTLS